MRLWDLRPGAVLSRAGRLGALQTVRCATPASSYGRPGAAAPSCAALAPTSAPARPGPPAQTNLPAADANEVDGGPQGHPLAPCRTRTHSHLHLRTESLRGPRLPGWTRAVPARVRRRSGDLDPTGSGRAEKEENRSESGGRIPGAFECRAAASPPRPRCHFPSALRIPHPTQSAHRILTLNPNVVGRVWGQAPASRRSGPRQSSCKRASLSLGRGPRLGPRRGHAFQLFPGEVRGIHRP